MVTTLDRKLAFKPSADPGKLNWAQFPKFSIAGKTMVYDGVYDCSTNPALGRGFTHINTNATDDTGRLALDVSERAHLWFSIVNATPDQPWEVGGASFDHDGRCPWGNDDAVYDSLWQTQLNNQAVSKYASSTFPPVDFTVMDIEAMYPLPRRLDDVLALRGTSCEPPELVGKSDDEFVDEYKRQMARQYEKPMLKLRSLGYANDIGSFNDAPWQNFWHLKGEFSSWAEIVDPNNWEPVNYVTLDPEAPTEQFGPMHDDVDILTPSCYVPFHYDSHPLETAGDYLAGIMTQIEANRARTQKKMVAFMWLHRNAVAVEDRLPFRPHQAEAMGIFPFFGGVDGIWLWTSGERFIQPDTMYDHYEWFAYGLYRFAQWTDYHDRTLAEPYVGEFQDPYYLLNLTNERPIWRGLVRKDLAKMLVVTQDPYQPEDDSISTVSIEYKGKPLGVIDVKNRETKLVEFDLTGVL